MAKPKDAKVWNEDLVAALEARYQQSLREGKRNAHTWQKGMGQIAAVRKDIYRYSSGRIANLPTDKLSKTVLRLCEDIIGGVKNVYPDGHVPSNGGGGAGGYSYGAGISAAAAASPVRSHGNVVGGIVCDNCGSTDVERHAEAQISICNECGNVVEESTVGGGGFASFSPAAAAAASPAAPVRSDNPFTNDNYMKKLKIRGGAFAILMAFHHSQTDVLLKAQIIREGQKFCDEQMDANYMAGRPHGAWSGIKTLKDHNFVTEESNRQYTDRGWRGSPSKYTLTRDGKMFVEALLANRPEAEVARRQAAGTGVGAGSVFGSPGMRVGGAGGNSYASPARHTLNHIPSGARIIGPVGGDLPFSSDRSGTSRNVEKDRAELEQWMDTADVGESKLFDVGKDRRLKLHRLCDSLMEERPGLILTHGSVGEGRSRALTIQLVQKPMGAIGTARKRSYARAQASASALSPEVKRSRTNTPAQNAALAAIKRQEQTEMKRTVAKEEEDLEKALAESAKMAAKATPARQLADNSAVEIIDGDEDEEDILRRAIKESVRDSERKPAAKRSDEDVVDVIDSDDDDERKMHASSRDSGARKKIDLSQSDDDDEDDDNVIEINDSQEEPIDLLDSQPQAVDDSISDSDDSLPPASGLHSPPLTGKKPYSSSIMKASNVRTDNPTGDGDVVVIGNGDEDDNHLRAQQECNSKSDATGVGSTLFIGTAEGGLAKWVAVAQVEEEKLEYGDFGFSKIDRNSGGRRQLGISIERKRANDLVQRSYDGDHLTQLRRMQQSCSLSFLLIEYDTRLTGAMTAYNANDREGFDPLDSTITCEEDVYRMFGRAFFTSDSIRFIQTKDEQASLRAVGALGLVAASAPDATVEKTKNKQAGGVQALNDMLKQGGVPWRMAQRVARVIGGIPDLENLYKSCCDDEARQYLVCHLVSLDGDSQLQGDLKSSPKGWSEAIYRIVMSSKGANSKQKGMLNGEAALLLHKELIEDHGKYLGVLYEHGCTPNEALDRVLNSSTSSAEDVSDSRCVSIHLTKNQAEQYFPLSGGSEAFYKLTLSSDDSLKGAPITIRAVGGRRASKRLLVYEMEGTELADIVQDVWKDFSGGSDFVVLAERIAQRIDGRCDNSRSSSNENYQKVLMLCGLNSALDAIARKPGYHAESRAVVDMVLSNLMIRRDVDVVQALRKNAEDRKKLVQQLALACLHHGLLVERSTV